MDRTDRIKVFLAGFFHDLGKLVSFKNHALIWDPYGSELANIMVKRLPEIVLVGFCHDPPKYRVKKDFFKRKRDQTIVNIDSLRKIINDIFGLDAVDDILHLIIAVRYADSLSSILETPALRTPSRFFIKPLISNLMLHKHLSIHYEDIFCLSLFNSYEELYYNILKVLWGIEAEKNEEEKFNMLCKLIKYFATTPKETRMPYDHISLLSHSITTGVLACFIYDLIKAVVEKNEINAKYAFLGINSVDYLTNIIRLPYSKAKVEILIEVLLDYISRVITSCPEYFTSILMSYPMGRRSLLIASFSASFLLDTANYYEKGLQILDGVLEEYDLSDVITIEASSLLLKDISKWINYDPHNNILIFNENIRRTSIGKGGLDMRSAFLKLLSEPTRHISRLDKISIPSGGDMSLCEFCQIRSGHKTKLADYILCERCYTLLKRVKSVFTKLGAYVDNIADDRGEIAIVAISIDNRFLLTGKGILQYGAYPIAENSKNTSQLILYAAWSPDMCYQIMSEVLNKHELIYKHAINLISKAEEKHLLTRRYCLRLTAYNDMLKRLFGNTEFNFFDLVLEDSTYPSICSYDVTKQAYEIRVLGLSKFDVDIIKRALTRRSVVSIRYQGIEHPLKGSIKPVEIIEVKPSERIHIIVQGLNILMLLLPGIILLPVLDKAYEVYGLYESKIKFEIFSKEEPIYYHITNIRKALNHGVE